MRPKLVDRLEDTEGKVIAKYPPEVARRVVSETAARQMVAALKADDVEFYRENGLEPTEWMLENAKAKAEEKTR